MQKNKPPRIKLPTIREISRQLGLRGRRSTPDLVETLLAISRRCSALPDLDCRAPDEILAYDEAGAFR